MTALDAVAERLWQAHRNGRPIAPVRDAIAAAGGDLLMAAYAVQYGVHRRRLAAGARLIGRKIGLTSVAVQEQLGVPSPDFGALYDDMAVADGDPIPWASTQQAKAEVEVALVLAHDLTGSTHSVADLVAATAYALPAIEVVGSRIAGWDIQLADTVADNASSGLFVLGTRPVPLTDLDLVGCTMTLRRDDQIVSRGTGAACLGNPLHAAVWLADTMVRVGTPLRAGDVVLTGALGPMVDVAPGDRLYAHIEGLGTVRAAFAVR